MKLRKAIRKIAALGAGVTMVGATIMGAMAAGLTDYPSPFVADGKFSGVLVVGDKAAAEDVIGVTDIATSLQFSATTKAGTASGVTVTVQGDAWKVGTTSKTLELTENPITLQKQETFRNVTNSIGDDELDALADGEVDNDKGIAPYHQYFNFIQEVKAVDAAEKGYVYYVEDDNDATADFLYFPSSSLILQYEIEFTKSLASDNTTTDTTSNLDDLENEKLTLIGEEFTIIKAHSTAAGVKLTLMSGPVLANMQEGETKTFTINGKEYEVTVPIITDTGTIYAKFVVNGESTDAMVVGDTEKLADGTYLGVKSILPNEAGDVSQDLVEFYLGASKLVLEDQQFTAVGDGGTQQLEVDGESVNDVNVEIDASSSSGTEVKIDSILMNVTADDDFYVGAGEKLSEQMDEPEALFTGNWDIEYRGLTSANVDPISVKSSGSRTYDLKFMDADGNTVSVPIAYASNTSLLKMGDSNDNFVLSEGRDIKKNDYFVVSDTTEQRGQRSTWVLRYKGADKSSDTDPQIRFENVGSNENIVKSYKYTDDSTKIRLGGQDFLVVNDSLDTTNDFNITVDLGGNGAIGSTDVAITTKYGAEIGFGGYNGSIAGRYGNFTGVASGLKINISTPDADDYEDVAPTVVVYNITATTGPEVRMAHLDGLSLLTPEDQEEVSYGYTALGGFITYKQPSGSPQDLIYEYPDKQRTPEVYFTAGTVVISAAGSTEAVESVTISKIEVGATKLASEVTDVTAQNVIAVGGPCANAVAAEVMGNPADCTTGFSSGKGRILLFDNGENVALVVAGYSAIDTRNAAQVLANYGDHALTGTAVEIT
ncbi:MAG TPA: hypothetical protein VJH97_01770, partial [Candidatus Nanoarchaeia archaeon]|nr:hypothetical protein [Candidatus Nanoarchaeia archaeon]